MLKFLLAVLFLLAPSVAIAAETAYERVTRTGTLRCGYISWPRLHDVDLKSGTMSGMWYDYMMTLGTQLSLKIEWAEEIGPADFIAALTAGRIDAMCAPIGRLIPRMRGAAFAAPLTYIGMSAYVRANDARFDNGLASLNAADVRITSMEGEFNSVIARTRFPKAQLVEFAPMLGPAQGYMNVATSKADVVFADALTIEDYQKNNPGKLKPLSESLGVFGASIAVAGQELALLHMLDDASRVLVESGVIQGLTEKYGLSDHMLLPVYAYQRVQQ